MSAVDDYIEGLEGPPKAELERIVHIIRRIVPEAEPGVSYGMPAFRYKQQPLMGIMAAKTHLSLFPFSSDVIERLHAKLAGFDISKGTVRFAHDKQLPEELVMEIIRLRQQEIDRT